MACCRKRLEYSKPSNDYWTSPVRDRIIGETSGKCNNGYNHSPYRVHSQREHHRIARSILSSDALSSRLRVSRTRLSGQTFPCGEQGLIVDAAWKETSFSAC